MAHHQSRKVLLISVEVDENGNKIIHRYIKNKSHRKGKPVKKLSLKKYNPRLRKHVLYKEAKYK